MADAVETFQVTCPANRAKANPLEVSVAFQPAEVETVTIRWPAGHASKTGIGIAVAHQIVIPNTAGGYIVGDNMERHYPLVRMPHTGAWSVFLYNTDVNAHYWQIEFHTSLIRLPHAYAYEAVRPIPVGMIHAHRDNGG